MRPPIGSEMLEVRKSHQSKTFFPRNFVSASGPKESAQKKPITMMTSVLIMAPVVRETWNSSTRNAVSSSSIETELVRAANVRQAKNATANSPPNGSWAKITGIVTKVSPGPAAGSRWKANTAGITIRAPRIEAAVVSPTICAQDFRMRLPCGRYEP